MLLFDVYDNVNFVEDFSSHVRIHESILMISFIGHFRRYLKFGSAMKNGKLAQPLNCKSRVDLQYFESCI